MPSSRDRILYFFDSTIGVKQEFPISLTLFGLRIDELEQMVRMVLKEEGVEEAFLVCGYSVFCKYFRRCSKAYEGIGRVLCAYYAKCQQLKQRLCL